MNSVEKEEDDSTSDSEKCERDIEDWISLPCEPPSSNEGEESEGKEEDVGATQATNTRKVMSMTGKTAAKTPGSRMKKYKGRSFIEAQR